jgi:hypothetical protein
VYSNCATVKNCCRSSQPSGQRTPLLLAFGEARRGAAVGVDRKQDVIQNEVKLGLTIEDALGALGLIKALVKFTVDQKSKTQTTTAVQAIVTDAADDA